jgi:hypothetical protein
MGLGVGTVVADRFRLLRVLGEGGMGAVWLAHDGSLDTQCAIKFIHGEAAESAEIRGRFEREAKSAAGLRSPHVVQILDYGVSDCTPYIAMEYLEGEDLSQRLNRLGRLPPAEVTAIMTQVAKALTKAHAAGLVHRDLKPANIFLVKDEDHDLAKVLDFGVAKTSVLGTGDGNTKTGSLLGTPYYMSPEQARGIKAVDHRSDLWAFAVIVFQCVTGRLPFVSEALGDLLIKIVTEDLPVPSTMAPDVPLSFDAWWSRAAQRDPARRFQSARELVDSLGLALGTAQSGMASLAAGPQMAPNPWPGGGPQAGPTPGFAGGSQATPNPWPRGAPQAGPTPWPGGAPQAGPTPWPGGAPQAGPTPWPTPSPGQQAMPSRPPSAGDSGNRQAAPGQSVTGAGTVALPVATQAGVSSSSVAERAPRKGGAGVLLAVIGGLVVVGGVVAVIAMRGHGAPAPASTGVPAAATDSPAPSGVPATTAPPATLPATAAPVPPTATVSAAPPVPTATTAVLAKPPAHAGNAGGHPPPPPPAGKPKPAGKPVDDGI